VINPECQSLFVGKWSINKQMDKLNNHHIFIIYVADLWVKKIESYHDIFLEREKYKCDESKRPDSRFSKSELLGYEGSFRKLQID
jgi:hypothetical protein